MDIVHLPSSISASDLPPDVRKYLINVDGSDARAYEGTTTSGWEKDGNIMDKDTKGRPRNGGC